MITECHVGDVCRCIVPIPEEPDWDKQAALVEATASLQRLCSLHGMVATDVRFVSSESWTEPVADVGPLPGFAILTYEATAA